MNRYCIKTFNHIRYWDIHSLERVLDFVFYWQIKEMDIHIITPFTEY